MDDTAPTLYDLAIESWLNGQRRQMLDYIQEMGPEEFTHALDDHFGWGELDPELVIAIMAYTLSHSTLNHMQYREIRFYEWLLVSQVTLRPIHIGEVRMSFRNEPMTIEGGKPPLPSKKAGRVYTNRGEFYPEVVGAKWIKTEQ
jgi:hypothetical protein